MELIFLDTETTGNDVSKDRLCQVCFKVGDLTRTEYFVPPVPMTIKSMSITHITPQMFEGKVSFKESEMKAELQKLLDEGIQVAHNARFDKAMLEAEGMNIPRFICTLRVARHLDSAGVIPEYNLQYLRYYYELQIEGNPHDAEGDVNVLVGLFKKLLSLMMEGGMTEEDAIKKMIEISSHPSLYRVFNFGKHKDKLISDVVKTDKNYLEWLLAQKLTTNDDEDWIYTLKHYLGK